MISMKQGVPIDPYPPLLVNFLSTKPKRGEIFRESFTKVV